MAFTQADVDAIKKAIASGADQVSFPDGSAVRYRSVTDMQRALAMAQADVASTLPGGSTVVSFASYDKG